MEKLKTLNLISVLNNMKDNDLEYVLSNTNIVKLQNIFNKITCNKCYKNVKAHHTCYNCCIVKCKMFHHFINNRSLCLDCVGELYVKKNYNQSFIIIDKNSHYKFYICTKKYNAYKEGPISKEEALKLLKKYTTY